MQLLILQGTLDHSNNGSTQRVNAFSLNTFSENPILWLCISKWWIERTHSESSALLLQTIPNAQVCSSQESSIERQYQAASLHSCTTFKNSASHTETFQKFSLNTLRIGRKQEHQRKLMLELFSTGILMLKNNPVGNCGAARRSRTLQPKGNQTLKSLNHDTSKEPQILLTYGAKKTGFAAITTLSAPSSRWLVQLGGPGEQS